MAMSYIAIILAAVVSMIIGFLWYGPLFGAKWMKLMGIKKQKAKKQAMVQPMLIDFIATIVTAYVLTMFLGSGTAALDAITVAFYVWIGFVAPLMLGSVLWEKRPIQLYAINVTYRLVSLVVMALILSLILI